MKYPEPSPLRRRGRLFSVSSLLGNTFVLVKDTSVSPSKLFGSLLGNTFVLVKDTSVSPSKGILERIKVEDAGEGDGGHLRVEGISESDSSVARNWIAVRLSKGFVQSVGIEEMLSRNRGFNRSSSLITPSFFNCVSNLLWPGRDGLPIDKTSGDDHKQKFSPKEGGAKMS